MIRAVFLSRTNIMETASLILVDIHLEMEKKMIQDNANRS